MNDFLPVWKMQPTNAPEIVGIAQIAGSGPTTLSPGTYYFAYALSQRIGSWPRFILSNLGPAMQVVATESFNAVDLYDHPETVAGHSVATLYMTNQYPDKATPVNWKAVNTVALGDPETKTLLTVGLLGSTGVYDAATLNDILQTNNAIANIIHTEGRSTAATGKIQIGPVGSLAEEAPTGQSLAVWIGIAVVVVVLGVFFAIAKTDLFRDVICQSVLGNVLFVHNCSMVR